MNFTPTLSYLLGIPIPFNNFGFIMPEVFLENEKIGEIGYLNNVVRAGYLNLKQIMSYIEVN